MVMISASSVLGQQQTCWQCTGDSKSWCADPFKAPSPIPAFGTCNGTYCTKTATTESGQTTYNRACNQDKQPYNGCQGGPSGGITTTLCYCTGNLCNGAGLSAATFIAAPSSMTLAAATGVVLFIATRRHD